MRRWHDLTEVPRDFVSSAGSVLTIGVFDGVHRGHQKVIGAVVKRAAELGVPGVVMTLDPHPTAVVRPEYASPLLATVAHRLDLFERYGADAALVLPFTKERSQQPAEEFVREVHSALRPKVIVVGDDFRFGFKATGDVALLSRLGEELGFTVEAMSREAGDPRWSSSAIREALAEGDVATAGELLGHGFRVDGVVVRGAGRGAPLLDTPTANIPVEHGRVVPADGVYATWVTRLDEPDPDNAERMPGATSVGTNPQFGEDPRQVEAFIIDRRGLELYDVPLAVEFVERVRGQETFASIDELKAQIRDDAEKVAGILGVEGEIRPPR